MSKQKKTFQSSYTASSFWLDRDFDTNFKTDRGVDLTKLAAAQRAIGNFVNIVTGKQIPVVFQSSDTSYTDGERVVIGTKLEDKNFDPAVGLALHEGSHIALTDFSLFRTLTDKPTQHIQNTVFADIIRNHVHGPVDPTDFDIIKDILNWIEDRRIDYFIYTTAPGYRMYYESMYNKYFNDKIIDKALKTDEKIKETWDDYMFHLINFTNPNRKLGALKSLNQIWSLIDLKNINRLTSTKDALLVAIDVYKTIKESVTAAEAETKMPKTTKVKGSSIKISIDGSGNVKSQAQDDDETGSETENGDEGDGNSKSDEADDENNTTNGSGDGMSEDGDESNENGDNESIEDDDDNLPEDEIKEAVSSLTDKELKKLQDVIEQQKQFLDGKSKKTGRVTKQQSTIINAMRESGTELRPVATGLYGGKSDIIDTVVIKKLTHGIIQSLPNLFTGVHYVDGTRDYQKDVAIKSYYLGGVKQNDDAVTRGIILGKQLGRKLQIRDSERSLKSTRLQSGKIDRRLISQLGYDNVNVFHRIVTDKFKDYFIHISIDASGSMAGKKFENAITSAVAVAQAASMTTGIRVQISLRGTDNVNGNKERCVTLYAYDSAHDKMSKIRNMFKYLKVFGCTPEGLSFKSIEADIRKDAKGDECIFINYSDGEPTNVAGCARSYNGVDFTKKIINTYREIGINIISYFIYDGGYLSGNSKRSFNMMYGPDAQFINPTNMNDVSKSVNAKFLELAN